MLNRGLRWGCAVVLAGYAAPAMPAADPIVIGMSLPTSNVDDTRPRMIAQGTRAHIEAINATGGIGGRLLALGVCRI